jgi:hypothetical protein
VEDLVRGEQQELIRAGHTEQGSSAWTQPLLCVAVGRGKAARQVAPAPRWCTIEIQAGAHSITGAGHCPPTCATPLTTFTGVQVRTTV